MSRLQPGVHPQPSVCGEYDGKFTRHFQLTQQTPAQVTDSIVRLRLPARCHALQTLLVCPCELVLVVWCQSVCLRGCLCEECYLTLGLPNTSCVNSILRFAFSGYCVLCHLLEPHGESLICVCVCSFPPR